MSKESGTRGIHWLMIRYLMRPLWWLNGVVAAALFLITLVQDDVIHWRDQWLAIWCIVAHVVVCSLLMVRQGAASATFLYTRGFGRRSIWLHRWVASLLCMFMAWTPMAILIWGRLRSSFQDVAMENANFPVMAPLEVGFPLAMLLWYLFLWPLMHYAVARQAQPDSRPDNGWALAAGWILGAMLVLNEFNRHDTTPLWVMWLASLAGLVIMLRSSAVLHAQGEVR